MTDFTPRERTRRRPVALSEDATSRAIREIEAEHLDNVRTGWREAAIWTGWEAIVGMCVVGAAALVAVFLN
jgi:hypothetical protein